MDDTPKDNVTPIRPTEPVGPAQQRVTDEPYSTPSRAIALMLRKGGFDKEAIGKGPLEIRIIAEFSETGAMFHQIGAMQLPPRPSPISEAVNEGLRKPTPAPASLKIDAPAMTVLKLMADDNNMTRGHYINLATAGELTALDRELQDASMEDLETLAAGELEAAQAVAYRLKATQTIGILNTLFERG